MASPSYGSPGGLRGNTGLSRQTSINTYSALTIADFSFCGILGEGEFGRVMMARNNHTQDIVAVKVLRKGFLVQKGSRTVTHAISEKQVRARAAARTGWRVGYWWPLVSVQWTPRT